MRPLIGIPCRTGVRGENAEKPVYYSNQSYVHAVESAGGVPIIIPIMNDYESLRSLLSRLDGLLLSGGIDVHPSTYKEEAIAAISETDPALDKLELHLARWAYQEDMPTLGICRGMQLMNVARGGTLYQDLDTGYENGLQHANWHLPRNQTIHSVSIDPDSRMYQILGSDEVLVNSLHHQAVKKLGDGVAASGLAEDGIIELLELPERTFMLGTQCHPEELYHDNPIWARLFRSFVEASIEKMSLQLGMEAPVWSASA
ncbi:gamma-glutamyl-gamma-aminobutyrate hydrolase family protein [Dictyobacter kobayashii]|uniref:Gamma-glutamyl-gamma-aminobutyrate hydrolase n=1 Tax=Dictyobacter kobayashii TaxID=2014872 RepID=A0A402AY68_9CHLR|nr:gamma-glutamyl-gamma-aminobutyrate hydrolase family protein [Dictyobacter kobayashii]GCE24024.1 gamma-glutamyl-gamma-aminobutyrate hydrolase [Dictyobacter kobayashii]